MFSSDSVVGEIGDPQGCLKVGNVGDTECVYFHYKSNQGDNEFQLVYTARELSSLIASVKKAAEMAPTLKPRSTIRLSAQPPKPIRLQVVLVAPENKPPLIILRFLGSDWKQDIFSQPETLLELLEKAERKAPMPAVVGILDRFGSAIWMIEGQTLEVRDDLSHGTGYYREYMHHSEVPEGVVVRAWPLDIDGKMYVAAFEYSQSWEPGIKADLPQGQTGDQALNDGLVRQSREVHALLSKAMFESKRMDPVWSAKVALSSMVGDIMMSDDKTGLATWSGSGGNPVLKAGVASVRDGILSPYDSALFAMISAYYESEEPALEVAVDKVNTSMAKAWKYAIFNAPELRRLVLANWYLLLRKAAKGTGAGPFFAQWEEAKSQLTSPLKPTVYCLPPAYPWVKSWPTAKTSRSEDTSQAEKSVQAEATISANDPLPKLPDLPPTANSNSERASGSLEEEEAAPWNDDLLSDEKRPSKKKSPLPMVIVGLLVLGAPAAYYFMTKNQPSPQPSPTASSAATPIATASPAPIASATPVPDASATPHPAASLTPVTPTATAAPINPLTGSLPAGDLLINGFSFDKKLKEQDIFAAGYEPVDRFTEKDKGIARYQGAAGEVIVNFKLPSREVTAIQGDHLTLDGKTVATLDSLPETWKDDERFSKFKLEAVVDDEGKVRAFTLALDGIYVAEPIVGSPKRALELSRKIKNKKFFETLPTEVANMRLTDGTTLIFQFLGSFETDRLEYLIQQGADPNAKSWADGETPLHACKNVKTAEVLLKLGADPNAINKMAQTPFEATTNEELKAVLDPAKGLPKTSPTPKPVATPATSATPASSSPKASPSPGK
jgi:Ankyrin repeat